MYIILIFLFLVKSRDTFDLEIDKSYQFYVEVPNSWLSYPVQQFSIIIPQDMIQKDIFVFLTNLNDTRTNIQLHQMETELKSIQAQQTIYCMNQGLDLCKLYQNYQKTQYFLVFCKVSCHYQINVMTANTDEYLSNEIIIKSITQEEGKPLWLNLTNIKYERFYLRIIPIATEGAVSLYRDVLMK